MLKMGDIAHALNSALASFLQDCLDLIGGLMDAISSQLGEHLDLAMIETGFKGLPEVGSSTGVIDDPARRQVKPRATHS
jgi:hypothetical protein